MARITLDQVQKARENGPIFTDAEIAEGKKVPEVPATPKEKRAKKAKTSTQAVKEIEKVPEITQVTPSKWIPVVDIFQDTKELNDKFFSEVTFPRDYERLAFEISRWKEELNETITAINEGDAEGVVDGAIDLMTFIADTLYHFGVDGAKAWKVVHDANMAKEKGTKSTRPNSNGVDLIKPKGWKAPDHKDNLGYLAEALSI